MIKDFLLFITAVVFVYSFGIYAVIAEETVVVASDKNVVEVYLSYSQVEVSNNGLYRADLMVDTNEVPLNAFEVEFTQEFTTVNLIEIVPTNALCESRFVIENEVTNNNGHLVCGTITPLTTNQKFVSVASIYFEAKTDSAASLSLGEKTNFYIHDGLGTQATLAKLENQPSL